MKILQCSSCSAPLHLSKNLCWHNNGVISLSESVQKRWVFFDSSNIDILFRKLTELIGFNIDRLIIESRSRGARKYLEKIIPQEIRNYCENERNPEKGGNNGMAAAEREKFINLAKSSTVKIYDVARIYGYGNSELGEGWERKEERFPWRDSFVRKPYSLLMNLAESLGQCEAMEGRDLWIRYEKDGEEDYRYQCFEGDHPINLERRQKHEQCDFKAGDIEFERCPECNLPLDVVRCNWDLEDGTIIDPVNGRRLAIYGPHAVDSILSDLEYELGEEIPSLVIEAERRYIKDSRANESWKRTELEFRNEVALRGLGNIVEFEPGKDEHRLLIENPCLKLMMAGIVQALVELARGWDKSSCSHRQFDNGDLEIVISR